MAIAAVLVLSSCDEGVSCADGLSAFNVYLSLGYLPHSNYAFIKGRPDDPMGFTVSRSEDYRLLQRVAEKGEGRDLGIEAVACGKIEKVDLPLTLFGESLLIDKMKVISEVDMTDMIDRVSVESPAVNKAER